MRLTGCTETSKKSTVLRCVTSQKNADLSLYHYFSELKIFIVYKTIRIAATQTVVLTSSQLVHIGLLISLSQSANINMIGDRLDRSIHMNQISHKLSAFFFSVVLKLKELSSFATLLVLYQCTRCHVLKFST
jgi:hypothetical protein